jgi:hypothetical protein
MKSAGPNGRLKRGAGGTSVIDFGDVIYDPNRTFEQDNEIGLEVLRRLGLPEPKPAHYLDDTPLVCPACGEPIEDDDEETWYLPEGVFWHEPCYTETAMPVVGKILEEEWERRIKRVD